MTSMSRIDPKVTVRDRELSHSSGVSVSWRCLSPAFGLTAKAAKSGQKGTEP